MTATTPEEERAITEMQESPPVSRWHIYHLIRLQGELSAIEQRIDAVNDRQGAIIWGLVIGGAALLLNLMKG